MSKTAIYPGTFDPITFGHIDVIKKALKLFDKIVVAVSDGENKDYLFDSEERLEINQWLMAQMGYVGPMLGQHHQFHHYNPGKSKFGEERYFKITKSIYKDLDERLEQSKYLSGENYSIADIATWPWIARHEWHDVGLKNYKNLTRWYLEIADREAVVKGYNFMDKEAKIPLP